MTDNLLMNDEMVHILSDAINWGDAGLKNVPGLLKRIIREDMWRKRVMQETGQVVEFARFADFVTTLPLEGLGADLRTLQKLCSDDPEALDLIDQVQKGESAQGKRNDLVDNINEVDSRPTGTSAAYALRRLRKDRPDLHQRVINKELSAHAAMVAAGFSRPRLSVYLDDIEAIARALARHLSDEQLSDLIACLSAEERVK